MLAHEFPQFGFNLVGACYVQGEIGQPAHVLPLINIYFYLRFMAGIQASKNTASAPALTAQHKETQSRT